jgi:CP family cyanate transporter-like MFS transporter
MLWFLGRNAWVVTFVFWGVPVIGVLALWLWLAPSMPMPTLSRERDTASRTSRDNPPRIQQASANALHLGVLIGSGSLVYFGMNAWIATYDQAIHQENLTPLTLAILNAAQLPVSLLITPFAQQLAGRRSPFVAAGSICTLAIAGWIFTPAALEPFWVVLLGGSAALVFTLGIALPPLLARPEEVARLTGSSLSLNYSVAFVGPFVGGWLWDLFHLPILAFLPVAVASVLLILLGALLPSRATVASTVEIAPTSESRSDATMPTPPAL